jgi:mannose-6-phosphate isomerase-like protein (cupin superfamily)
MDIPGMNQGTGTMTVRMYNDDSYRIIPTTIHVGASIGTHMQESGDDMNYIIGGTGKAICDGKEERLELGVMHICPKGSEHSIVNTGEEDLVMLTLVIKDR